MTERTRTKTWAVLPMLGLLTWAVGCHSEAPAPPAAGVSAAPVQAATPSVAQSAAAEAVTPSSPESVAPAPIAEVNADVPAPPVEPVSEVRIGAQEIPVSGFEPTVDGAVGQAAAKVKGAIDRPTQVHDDAPAAAPPSLVAPTTGPIAEGVQFVADEVKAGVRKTADEVANGVKQEVNQTFGDLQQKAKDQTQKAAQDLLNKADRGTKDVVNKGLKRAKDEVKKELGQGR